MLINRTMSVVNKDCIYVQPVQFAFWTWCPCRLRGRPTLLLALIPYAPTSPKKNSVTFSVCGVLLWTSNEHITTQGQCILFDSLILSFDSFCKFLNGFLKTFFYRGLASLVAPPWQWKLDLKSWIISFTRRKFLYHEVMYVFNVIKHS